MSPGRVNAAASRCLHAWQVPLIQAMPPFASLMPKDKPANSKRVVPSPNEDAPRIEFAGRCPRAIVVFLLIVVAALASDLLLKQWSFDHVAGVPLKIEAGDDGPVVYTHEGEEWVRQAPRHREHPATAIPEHDATVVIPKLLNLQLTLNTGAVFGTGQGNRGLFIVVSIIATGVILVLVWRSDKRAWCYRSALALILAGALGNLYDRVCFAGVRDMLHMLPETPLWPWLFNIADVALVVGVLTVLVLSWCAPKPEKPAAL